jgi:hypothetical protein
MYPQYNNNKKKLKHRGKKERKEMQRQSRGIWL